MINRRTFSAALSTGSAMGFFPASASAQTSSNTSTRILVGFPAGGVSDALARRLADQLRGAYSPVVLIDNKPGAGGQIAVSHLRESSADGSSILLTPSIVFSLYPFTYPKLPYRADDLAPVSVVCTFHLGLAVGPAVPTSVRTLNDFVGWCKADPARASYGSPAAGSTTHLIGEQMAREIGIKLTHVAYKGNAPGIQDLLGGQIPAFVTPVGDFLPYEKSGKLRVLAVSGESRNRFFPEVPTFREQGFPISSDEWYGVFMPGKTPNSVLQRASAAVQLALAHPEVVAAFAQYGMTPQGSTPAAARERLQADITKWGSFIKQTGFTVDS